MIISGLKNLQLENFELNDVPDFNSRDSKGGKYGFVVFDDWMFDFVLNFNLYYNHDLKVFSANNLT